MKRKKKSPNRNKKWMATNKKRKKNRMRETFISNADLIGWLTNLELPISLIGDSHTPNISFESIKTWANRNHGNETKTDFVKFTSVFKVKSNKIQKKNYTKNGFVIETQYCNGHPLKKKTIWKKVPKLILSIRDLYWYELHCTAVGHTCIEIPNNHSSIRA